MRKDTQKYGIHCNRNLCNLLVSTPRNSKHYYILEICTICYYKLYIRVVN